MLTLLTLVRGEVGVLGPRAEIIDALISFQEN